MGSFYLFSGYWIIYRKLLNNGTEPGIIELVVLVFELEFELPSYAVNTALEFTAIAPFSAHLFLF